jgi:hypothetical protein
VSSGLNFAEILTLAERQSGGYDLADPGLIARAEKMVDWINSHGPYTGDEVRRMRTQVLRLLANRLRLALDRKRFPAIAEEKIERPIFVIGFARSGTTLLHSLLAEDPEVLSLQSWHMYSPSPPPGAGPVVSERMAYAQRMIEAWMDFCPAQKPMHPYIDKGAVQLLEDEETFSLDFRNAYCYHYYHVPTLIPMVILDSDQVGAFEFHRGLLQHLQWNTGKKRWAGKGPSHQNNLDALFEVYPDALCVWSHRAIGDIVASLATLSGVIFETIQGKPSDTVAEAKMLAEGMKAGFDAVLANALIDDPRILHMPFKEIAADPVAAVRKIHDRAGLEVSPGHEQRMRSWLADPENAVDRYGRYDYSYERLGLKQEAIEEMFAEYSQRFGLA